jgi:hypothetical protein
MDFELSYAQPEFKGRVTRLSDREVAPHAAASEREALLSFALVFEEISRADDGAGVALAYTPTRACCLSSSTGTRSRRRASYHTWCGG